jgi:hypothetical protein
VEELAEKRLEQLAGGFQVEGSVQSACMVGMAAVIDVISGSLGGPSCSRCEENWKMVKLAERSRRVKEIE